MKKVLSLLAIASVLASALFFGCDFLTPPEVQKVKTAENADSTDSTDSADSPDSERKDDLALKHLQTGHIFSEETLASFVMDFINIDAELKKGTGRSVQPSPAIAITQTTKIMHPVETGFAETTADKRSARALIGPGEIPFYVFTLENQDTGETGFALTCADSRIGNVLAVVDEGNYDDLDDPFLGIFYTALSAYIEDTISIYNGVTEADIENTLNKLNGAGYRGMIPFPVTDVGSYSQLALVGRINDHIYNNDENILQTKWHQGDPYNKAVMKYLNNGNKYVTGCGPVAIAQIMAFHGTKNELPSRYSIVAGFTDVKFDWKKMTDTKNPDNNAIATLMLELGARGGSFYLPMSNSKGDSKKGGTAMPRTSVLFVLPQMGYNSQGAFRTYDFDRVKSSVNAGYPVLADGTASVIKIFGLEIPTPIEGHYWVIDGYRTMGVTTKNDKSAPAKIDKVDRYVHCNMGWKEDKKKNGWYVSKAFDTKNIPFPDDDTSDNSTTKNYNFKYSLGILTNIRPR
jgi:hypothetical protein